MLTLAATFLLIAALAPEENGRSADCLFDDAENVPASKVTAADLDYFQPSIWTCEGDRNFYGGWYGRHLRTMGEPSFAAADALNGFSVRYRLLVLPSFTPAYSIRVDYPVAPTAGASAAVTAVTETGSGGYNPGDKVPLWSRDLHPRVAQRLNDAVRAANIQDRPRRLPPAEPEHGQIIICGDGTTYVVETLDRDGGNAWCRATHATSGETHLSWS